MCLNLCDHPTASQITCIIDNIFTGCVAGSRTMLISEREFQENDYLLTQNKYYKEPQNYVCILLDS